MNAGHYLKRLQIKRFEIDKFFISQKQTLKELGALSPRLFSLFFSLKKVQCC